MNKILLIEDDQTILETLAYLLRNAGYETVSAPDGRTGIKKFKGGGADLVLLDAMLPDISGFEVCQYLRDLDKDVKVIMVTALGDREDVIRGMDTGADDYVTKPFDIEILLARIRSLLRRSGRSMQVDEELKALVVKDISVDPRSHKVVVSGHDVALTPKEFDLLYLLLKNEGRAFNRRELSRIIWNEDHLTSSRTVDAHIGHLRQKVENLSGSRFIETIHGFGYRCTFVPKEK